MASSSVTPSPPSSASLPPAVKDVDHGNWAELPPELTSSIMLRLGAIEILENAQRVCTSWRRVSKDPSMWRKICIRNPGEMRSLKYDLEIMCRHAVDRSKGGLLEIEIWYFGTDSLLNHIADSSSNLTSLRLAMCYPMTEDGFVEAVVKLPLLEELELSFCKVSGESLKIVGQSCPNLKTLMVNREEFMHYRIECDQEALAIAETMPGLRHLQLFANRLSNKGLTAILDNCPNLEHLDLRVCLLLNLVGDLEKRCSQRIKYLRRPNDSTDDYKFNLYASQDDSDSSESSDNDELVS